jgi:hypothetical protein
MLWFYQSLGTICEECSISRTIIAPQNHHRPRLGSPKLLISLDFVGFRYSNGFGYALLDGYPIQTGWRAPVNRTQAVNKGIESL